MQNGIKALKIGWGVSALFRQHRSPLFTIAHKNIGIPRYCQVTGHKFMQKSISFEKNLRNRTEIKAHFDWALF